MSQTTVVALAMSPRDWRNSFHKHCRDHSDQVAIRLVRDSSEALDSGVDLVIVDDDTSWLSAPFVVAARDRAISIVGVFDAEESDGHGRRFLQRLGIDVVQDSSVGPEELLTLVQTQRPDVDVSETFDSIVSQDTSRLPVGDRRVTVVGGPAGSGATEVSVLLAEFAKECVLIDVDETHPSIARRLGLGIHPHIISSIEALRGERLRPDGVEGTDLVDCLANRAVNGPSLSFDVIVGLAARDDWNLLRGDDTADLIEELSARWPLVVARLGPCLEDLSRWVDRYEVSRSVASKATRVVGVCGGTATGILRFVDWLVDISLLVGGAPVDVVINQAPKSASAREQLERQLREIVGSRVGQIIVVGRDSQIERASWEATVSRRGPLAKAVKELV